MSTIISEFDVKRDERKRFTIREAQFEHYHVRVFDDGHLELYPRILSDATLSLRTLEMMDSAMGNARAGRVGAPLDIAALEALADAED